MIDHHCISQECCCEKGDDNEDLYYRDGALGDKMQTYRQRFLYS
jgi:hypothetical protein